MLEGFSPEEADLIFGTPNVPADTEPRPDQQVTLSERYLRRIRRVAVGLGAFSLVNGVAAGISIAGEGPLKPPTGVLMVGLNLVLWATYGAQVKEETRPTEPIAADNS